MDWMIIILWGIILPFPLKRITGHRLRRDYGHDAPLCRRQVFLCCSAAGGVICLLADGHPGQALIYSASGLCLVMLLLTDNAVRYLPDTLVFPVLWSGLLFQLCFAPERLPGAVSGVIAGYLLLRGLAVCYAWRRQQEGLGGGDVKLFAAAGAWVGAESLALLMLLACLSALVVQWRAAGRILLRLTARQTPAGRENHPQGAESGNEHGPAAMAFGPYLIIAQTAVMMLQSAGGFH